MKAQHFGKTSHPPEKKTIKPNKKASTPSNNNNFQQTICQTKTRVKVQETKSVWKLLQSMESASCLPLFPPAAEVKNRHWESKHSRGQDDRPVDVFWLDVCLECAVQGIVVFSFYINVFLLFANLILEVNIQERKKDEYINLPIWSGLLTYGLQLKAGI